MAWSVKPSSALVSFSALRLVYVGTKAYVDVAAKHGVIGLTKTAAAEHTSAGIRMYVSMSLLVIE